ncbi:MULTISPECIES: cobalamin biosynthesis protein [unclassified Crossiella]|uniref:cobalamin biosynthesis protein n=1 Tax=unclassified Crossiella TaxID=2620835 RepID=UPI001FFF1A83|nr:MULTISPECIES: cobalamin biosynthesis protein [unclassified Crossiella]MCK2242558.1 cobalamin biosynthesis protein [Crossiella sp. S99.2]MCK2254412.1 cobalamin biosynthesis protein [Crossiella sp. S99.1]
MIGLFAASAAGRQAAAELAGRLGPAAVLADGPIRPALERLWPQLDAAVFLLATDSTIRLLAPLLRERHNDPAVVCVDEAERFAVALIDGPAGNARDLAEQVAEILGGTAVVTAAEHATGTTPLDDLVELLDAAVDGDLTACGAAVLAGERVRLANPLGFPLPALPANVLLSDTPLGDESPQWTVLLDDRLPNPEPEGHVLRLVPRTLVVGIGAGSGVSTTAVTTAVAALTDEHRLDHRAVLAFATVETKAAEPGIVEAVEDHGFWTARTARLLRYPAPTLATIQVPNPSPQVHATTGTPSVAEAAALHAATTLAQGAPTELAAEKTPRGNVTVAAARIRPRGRLAVIDLGPGHPDLRVPRAEAELRKAAVVVGTEQDLAQVRTLVRPGTELWSSGNPYEAATQAVDLATAGRAVALLSPTSPATGPEITLVAVPGLSPMAVAATALRSAPTLAAPHPNPAVQPSTPHQPPEASHSPADPDAAAAPHSGTTAPGGHIELLLSAAQPWPEQEQRLRGLAASDLPLWLSPTTAWQTLATEVRTVLLESRGPDTPAGVVRNPGRPDQTARWIPLAELDPAEFDASTAVVIGVATIHRAPGH